MFELATHYKLFTTRLHLDRYHEVSMSSSRRDYSIGEFFFFFFLMTRNLVKLGPFRSTIE